MMLKPLTSRKFESEGTRFAIVASEYNTRYVDAMLRAAKRELKRAGVKNIQVIRVPGAYEIAVVAARFAQNSAHTSRTRREVGRRRITPQAPQSVIICLGVILRGETTHAAHIGEAVSLALMQIQLQWGVPVIHEVLLLENEQQARVRCLNKKHNRGTEAAQSALAMARVMARLPAETKH